MKALLLVCALVLLPSSLAGAAESPWAGTWKLDLARSHVTGDTMTYAQGPDGLIHYSDGSAYEFDFRVDGKDYKTYPNRTVAWTADGDRAWKIVTKQDGIAIFESRREISADGKTMAIAFTGKAPDGTPIKNDFTYARVGGGKGLIGKWRSTKANFSAPDLLVISFPTPGTMRLEAPIFKYVAQGKTDGTPITPAGPMTPGGMTIGIKVVSPTKLSYAYRMNGKPDSYSAVTLSADGRTMTEVSWPAGAPAEKTSWVYTKQ